MEGLSQDQRENAKRQTELIHLTLGYHQARLDRGHPFALGGDLGDLSIKGGEGPLRLAQRLQGKPRLPLDLEKPSVIPSPIQRIQKGVLASVWDSYNQVFGLIDDSQQPELRPFLADPELDALIDEMNAAGERINADADRGKNMPMYTGSMTVHSGFEVGIGMLTQLAAIEAGIPENHPFDALVAARIMAKTNTLRLAISQMKVGVLFGFAPDQIHDFLDEDAPHGIRKDAMDEMMDPKAAGCTALGSMGETARRLLKRHELYKPELDQKPALVILGEKIREYVSEAVWGLRVKMDFLDSAALPKFDRRIVDRTILKRVP